MRLDRCAQALEGSGTVTLFVAGGTESQAHLIISYLVSIHFNIARYSRIRSVEYERPYRKHLEEAASCCHTNSPLIQLATLDPIAEGGWQPRFFYQFARGNVAKARTALALAMRGPTLGKLAAS